MTCPERATAPSKTDLEAASSPGSWRRRATFGLAAGSARSIWIRLARRTATDSGVREAIALHRGGQRDRARQRLVHPPWPRPKTTQAMRMMSDITNPLQVR